MTTATQSRRKLQAHDAPDPVILPAEFGGVSFGDETARVGVRVAREKLALEDADHLLCGKRIDCRIVVQPKDDDQAQQYSVDGLKFEIDGSADVTQVSFSPKLIKFGLTFCLEAINRGELSEFAKRQGRLEINTTAAIPAKTGRHKAGTPATDETNWRDRNISELSGVTGHDMDLLKEAGITTFGQLCDVKQRDGSFRTIKGVGAAVDARILEGFLAWMEVHGPGPLDEDDDEDDDEHEDD